MKVLFALLALYFCTLPLQARSFSEDYESALSAYEQGKIEDAFIHLKNALQENPSHLPSTLLMGRVYFASGNMMAAEQLFDEALELGADLHLVLPLLGTSLILQRKIDKLLQFEEHYYDLNREGQFEWHLLRGQAYLLQGKPEFADLEFRKADELFPNNVRAKNTTASFLLQIGKFDEAEHWIKASLVLEPKNEQSLQLMGELRQRQGQLAQALDYYQLAYTIDSDDPMVQRGLAQAYFGLAQYTEAGRIIEQILEQSPNDPTANLMKSWLLNYEGKSEESLTLLRNLSQKLAVLDPNGALYKGSNQYVHGLVEFIQGNFENARDILGRLLEERPGDDKALRILAETYLRSNQPDKAMALLEQRQRQVQSNLDLGLTLFNLYLKQNNLFRAEQLFRELDRKFTHQPALRIGAANLLSLQGKPTEALEAIASLDIPADNLGFHLLKGKLLLAVGETTSANAIADKLLENSPDNLDARNLLAATLIEMQKPNQAEQQIQKVLKQDPNNLSANFNLAVLYKARGSYKEAQDIITNVLRDLPTNVRFMLLMVDIALEQQQMDVATDWLNKVLIYEPTHKQAAQSLLNLYMATSKWSEAATLVNQLRQNDRLNPTLVHQQAKIYIAQRNYQAAKTNLDILFDLWSDSAPRLLDLAVEQIQIADLSGARKSLESAAKLSPNSAELKLIQVRLELKEGKIQQAANLTKQLDESEVKPSQLAFAKAEVAIAQQNWSAAAKSLQKAIKDDPDNLAAIVSFYQLSQQKIHMDMFQQSIEQRLAVNAEPSWVRKLLADSYLDNKDFVKAQDHYETLLDTQTFASNAAVLNNLANIYAKSDLQKALATAEKARKSGQNNPALMDTLGWLNAQLGQYDKALPLLREAYVLDSANPEIRYHLGFVLAKLNRAEEAKVQLQEATRQDSYPEFQDAVLLLNSLNK